VGEIEFYIVSGGLQDVLEGSKTLRRYFSGIYACDLAEDDETGLVKHVKLCVTFTEKTKYLFEINKGIKPKQARSNPYLVNKNVDVEKRRIPFKNMVYVGDGLTDIPCFSLLKKLSGTAFGVFDPAQSKSAKRALVEFLKPDRVISVHAPRIRELSMVVHALNALGFLLRVGEHRKEQSSQDRDNGDHDQQLNERKSESCRAAG